MYHLKMLLRAYLLLTSLGTIGCVICQRASQKNGISYSFEYRRTCVYRGKGAKTCPETPGLLTHKSRWAVSTQGHDLASPTHTR